MRELPMLAKAEVVRNILAGRQTQHRVPMKPQPESIRDRMTIPYTGTAEQLKSQLEDIGRNPKYQIGDHVYVRECFALVNKMQYGGGMYSDYQGVRFKADNKLYATVADRPEKEWEEAEPDWQDKWHSSMHMPKRLARIWLKVTGVRAEKLQDISEDDAKAEGVDLSLIKTPTPIAGVHHFSYKESFKELWNSCYGKGAWESNPWVWVFDFERLKR